MVEILAFIAQLVSILALPIALLIVALVYKHGFKKLQIQQQEEINYYYHDIY